MDRAEVTQLLREPSILEELRRGLGLPSEPVAVELRALGEASARQERRLEAVVESIDRLTQAQARTELRMAGLGAAQQHTEEALAALARRMDDGFARMDERFAGVDERFAGMDERFAGMDEHFREIRQDLAESAVRDERLERGLHQVRTEIGGLSQSFGFWVEDIVAADLPDWLEERHGWRVEDLHPDTVTLPDGRKEEVDGLGRATGPGGTVTVVCEAKSRIWPREVEEFRDKVDRLRASLEHPPLAVLVGYAVQRSARTTATELGIVLVSTREFRYG